MPSKAWQRWLDSAHIVLEDGAVWHGYTRLPLFPDEALNCSAVYYRDARRGDIVGYEQGLADLLEKRRVVTNDAQIVSWNGSRMDLDGVNPRTEIELEKV